MKKILIVAALSAALVSFGCARYQPAEQVNREFYSNADTVKTKILVGAKRAKWRPCQIDEDTVRLFRPYKEFLVAVEVTYNDKGYSILVDKNMTTLKDEEGKVHKAVNKLVTKLDRVILQIDPELLEGPVSLDLPVCEKVDDVQVTKGTFFNKWTVGSVFAWIDPEEKKLSADTLFTYKVTADNTVPEEIKQSMETRLIQYLGKKGTLALKGEEAHMLEVHMSNFLEEGLLPKHSENIVMQTMLMKTVVKDPAGKELCILTLSARVPPLAINFEEYGNTKITNKITAVLSNSMMQHLENEAMRK